MKVCTKCNKSKPTNDYSRKVTSKDGRETISNACKKLYDRIDRMNPNEKEFIEINAKENQKWLVMMMPYEGSQVSKWNINVNQ